VNNHSIKDKLKAVTDISFNSESIPAIIYELNENAISSIFSENYEAAIELLKKANMLIQKINGGSDPRNASIILLTHHNLALCYQK